MQNCGGPFDYAQGRPFGRTLIWGVADGFFIVKIKDKNAKIQSKIEKWPGRKLGWRGLGSWVIVNHGFH